MSLLSRALPTFLFGLAVMLATPASVLASEPERYLTVHGEGRVMIVPDMALVNLGVSHEAATAGEALSGMSERMAAVMLGLETAGVAQRDIQTSALTLAPVWRTPRTAENAEPRLVGFRASNTVAIRVRDLDSLGGMLDILVRLGANNIGGIGFEIADPSAARDEARRAAVADALSRARILADAAGVALGPIERIEDGGTSMPRPMALRGGMMSMAAESAVPIAEGELAVTSSVTLRIGLRADR